MELAETTSVQQQGYDNHYMKPNLIGVARQQLWGYLLIRSLIPRFPAQSLFLNYTLILLFSVAGASRYINCPRAIESDIDTNKIITTTPFPALMATTYFGFSTLTVKPTFIPLSIKVFTFLSTFVLSYHSKLK